MSLESGPAKLTDAAAFDHAGDVTAAECVQKLCGFLDVLYLDWLLLAAVPRARISTFFYAAAAAGFCAALAFCATVHRMHVNARPMLVFVALASFPPSLIGSVALLSSARLGPDWTLFWLGAALILSAVRRISMVKVQPWWRHGWPPAAHLAASEGLGLPSARVRRSPASQIPQNGRGIGARRRARRHSHCVCPFRRMAASMLKLFALPSRWKYVTFTSGAVFVQQSAEALSPALVFGLWKALGFDLSLSFAETTYSDQLAVQIFALVLPLSLLQYAVGLRAIRPLFREQVAKWFPPPLNLRD